jgi:hypothetical protein
MTNNLANDRTIPENEMWLHQPQAAAELQRAMEWAQNNPAQSTDLDALPQG